MTMLRLSATPIDVKAIEFIVPNSFLRPQEHKSLVKCSHLKPQMNHVVLSSPKSNCSRLQYMQHILHVACCGLLVVCRLGRWLTPFNYRDAIGATNSRALRSEWHISTGFSSTGHPPAFPMGGKIDLSSCENSNFVLNFHPIIYNYNCHSPRRLGEKPMKISQPHLCNVDLEWIVSDPSAI